MTATQTGHQSTASTATSTALPLSTAARELFAIGGRKQPPPSVQLLYTELCQGDRDIASDGSSLYCWKGDHWSTQSEQENIRHALDYLRSNAPHKMSSDIAAKCFKTALNYVAPLPAKPDAEAVIVPVTGAWLTLRDGQWTASEPQREIGITHRIAVRFPVPWGPYQPKPISPSSLFGQFLNRSLPDAEVQATVQEFIGSTLSARPTQLAAIFLGNGNNGKSVLLNIVRALHEKTAALQLDKLEGFNLVPIVGASLAISDEIPDRAIQQQQFKSLVSGGTVQIRPLYTPAFAYNPIAKFIINANFLPPTRDNTDGWWRRLLIVEWPVQIAYEDLIPDLDTKIIRDELHIVLDWALEGLRRVAARNFKPAKVLPKAISQAHRSAVLQANSVAAWTDDCGVAVKCGVFADKATLYEHYLGYCEKAHLSPLGIAQFYHRVKAQFPGMQESRKVMDNGARRARCVDLVTGQFPHAGLLQNSSPKQIDIKPPSQRESDDDFDPFSEIVAQALAIPKIPVINME